MDMIRGTVLIFQGRTANKWLLGEELFDFKTCVPSTVS